MIQDAHLHDTQHFDYRRGRRGIRYETAIAVALEADIADGAALSISSRHAARLEAELRSEARLLAREGLWSLQLVVDLNVSEDDRRAVLRTRSLLEAAAAQLRRKADVIRSARKITTVVCGTSLVTTYRRAA